MDIGIWQARDQAARKPVRGSRRGPAGGPNAIEVRERARAQGIEVKTAAGYPLTRWPDSRPLSARAETFKSREGCGTPRTCRCERVPASHSYAEASISIRDQQCRERYVAGRWYPTLGWARSPNVCLLPGSGYRPARAQITG